MPTTPRDITLSTDRLLLREYRIEDAERLAELANNRSVSRYLISTFPSPYTLADARWWIETGSKAGIVRAIEADGQLVGTVGAEPRADEHCFTAGIGYWIGEPFWGKGIATAALDKFVDQVFASTHIVRLQAWVYSANKASMRVLKKVGFTEEAILQKALYREGQFHDKHIFGLLRP